MDIILSLDPWILWLIGGVALLILEILTSSFLVACFGIGALGAALPAVLDADWGLQLATFAVISLLALLLVRPIVLRSYGATKPIATGIEALVGKRVRLMSDIPHGAAFGEITIDGDVWRARVEQGIALPAGTLVEVVGFDSLVLSIRPIEEAQH